MRQALNRPITILGQSMPFAAFALIVFVVAGSALLALSGRMGLPGLGFASLSPYLVARGEIWRALTWAFFEGDGQNLIFGCLMLGIFGRDLAGRWGGLPYLLICGGVSLAAGLLTSIIGLVWGDVYRAQYLSIWPLADALIVAWALLFPTRTILFMLMLPAAGRNLLYLTVGVTALFAVMYGFSNFIPHFAAMASMYAYVRGAPLVAARSRLNELLGPKRDTRGLRGIDGGWNRGDRKGPNGSGWVH